MSCATVVHCDPPLADSYAADIHSREYQLIHDPIALLESIFDVFSDRSPTAAVIYSISSPFGVLASSY